MAARFASAALSKDLRGHDLIYLLIRWGWVKFPRIDSTVITSGRKLPLLGAERRGKELLLRDSAFGGKASRTGAKENRRVPSAE